MNLLDWIAVIVFAASWIGYEPVLKWLARRGECLNDDMLVVRSAWMRAMSVREIRLVDSQLMGHSINSASFFASANLLLIAAVAGVLFGGEQALTGVAMVGDSAAPLELLEVKLGLVTVCLARGLLDFIWSIRQMNYTLALIGAMPDDGSGPEPAAYADATVAVLNPALSAFSRGVRTYYFALAAGAWLFGPLWLLIGAVVGFALLVWRQRSSPAAMGVREARRLFEGAVMPQRKKPDAG